MEPHSACGGSPIGRVAEALPAVRRAAPPGTPAHAQPVRWESPAPFGAGMSRSETEPHLPVTFAGTVCGLPSLLPQYPRRTGTVFVLAQMMQRQQWLVQKQLLQS